MSSCERFRCVVRLIFFVHLSRLSLSLTIVIPLVGAALVPPTRAPMKGAATKPSETLSPAQQ